MTGMDTTNFIQGWAKAAKDMVTQSKSWATTCRGMTMGPWQGLFATNETLAAAARPWFETTSAAHDQMLDMWERQTHAMIDATCQMTDKFSQKG